MRRFAAVFAFFFVASPASFADDIRVIVGFKGSPDAGLLESHGAKGLRALSRLDAIAAHLPPAAVARLRAEASVAYVEEDGIA
ncbi:MAG: S8 family serine peptidase, partial [Planctomycetota bacterium]